MAYTLDVTLALGAGNTGLTLEMQLKDTAGANVGAAVTTGFVEFGATGNYLFHYTLWPDSHRGAAVFQISGGGTVKACVPINPQEAEFTDLKTSTRSSHTAADVWANATRTLTSFGTLAADVWAVGTRTLTAFGFSVDLLQSAADKVWLSASRTLTSLGTVVADTAAAVWAYATRTLTMSAAQIAALLDGTTMTISRGQTVSIPITGLGNITTRTKLYLSVKKNLEDADTAAIIQVEETAGLIRLNGAAGTASQGSLTVTNATVGNVTFGLVPAACSQLPAPQNYRYDIRMIVGSAVYPLDQGVFTVNPEVTRAIT